MGLKGRCAKKAGSDRFTGPGWKGRQEGQGGVKRRGEYKGKGSAEGNGK